MNPRLKALHDQYQALINEAKAIEATATLSPDQKVRASELPAEIKALREEIDAAKALSDATNSADAFLNSQGSVIPSVTSAIKGVINTDPEAAMESLRKVKILGKSKYLSLTGLTQQEACQAAYRFGMFMLASIGRREHAAKYCQANGIPVSVAGMTEGVNEDGGALVPPEFENYLILLREQFGVFRGRARYTPMTREQKTIFRQTGGLTAYFVDEEDAITGSKANFDRVLLTAKKLGCLAYESTELSEDSIMDMGDILMGEIAYAFAKKEDQCGFVGDGTSTYGRISGVTNRLLTVFTTAGGTGLTLSSGNLWSELTLNDFLAVDGSLPAYAEGANCAWYCHKKFWDTVLLRLALASGGVTAAEVIAGAPRRFLGHDVIISQAMPSSEANSQVPAVLGDLSMAATFGDRRQTTVAWSEHYAFNTDQLAVRGTERFDINVNDVGATGTAGPVVGILTAAS